MRNQYWDFLCEIKFAEIYDQRYLNLISTVDTIIKWFLHVTSIMSAACLLVNKTPLLWSVILIISQLLQITWPYFPFQTHLTALKFFIPDLRDFVIDIEESWNRLNEEDQIGKFQKELIAAKKRRAELDKKYFKEISLPKWKRMMETSWGELKSSMQTFGNNSIGDDLNAECQSPSAEVSPT